MTCSNKWLCIYSYVSYSYPSPAPTDPPQNFTVTPEARNMTFSWSPPSTLRNGVITGYFLSCVPEVGGRNSASMQFTTAGTFTLVGFTPATSYNCSIFASNIWGNGPAAYSMVSTLDDCKYLLSKGDKNSYLITQDSINVHELKYSFIYCFQQCCSSYS